MNMTVSQQGLHNNQSVWPTERLFSFEQAKDDILVVDRSLKFIPYLSVSGMIKGEFRSRYSSTTVGRHVAKALDRLRINCPELGNDLQVLCLGFLDFYQVRSASLRLEVVDHVSCPKFHCDNVRIRLVSTYTGPGTEYIDTDNPDIIHQADTAALVFLKGHKHPTHVDKILHRSPAVPAGMVRLCAVIDV